MYVKCRRSNVSSFFFIYCVCIFNDFLNIFGSKISELYCLHEEKTMKKNEHVKTAIRWRPKTENKEVVIEKVNNKIISVQGNSEPFMVDTVFDSSEQSEVFDVLVKPLIDKAIEGFDFTFLATGQTGSGKTYTMGFERSVDPENSGIVTRVLNSLFSYKNAPQFQMQISFIEVYNNQAFDLLNSTGEKPFYTKEHPNHRTKTGSKQLVNTAAEVLTLLSAGIEKRRVRETKMNSISSRSHVIFTIYLNVTQKDNSIRPTVINLVDLAGSEGFRKTGNTGQAHAEGKSINEGLTAFKRVIDAMASARPDTHIPFRDSVITKLLQDSLNLRSYLTLLGCISPYKDDRGETLATLRFVCEAKKMKMTPQMKELVINYRKSMTPVKQANVSRTLKTTNSARNSSIKSFTPFKRPFPIHNKSSLLSKQMSEPRRPFVSSNVSSSASKHHSRMSAISSTSKKTSLNQSNRNLRSSVGGQAKKPKAVINLFPTEENDTTFVNDSILSCDNWNASSSSVIEVEPITPEPSNVNQVQLNQTEMIRKQLAQTLKTLVKTPMREQLINNVIKAVGSQLKENDGQIDEQNDVKDIKPVPSIIQSSPLSSPLPSPSPSPSPPQTSVQTPMKNCIDPTTPIKIHQTVEKHELAVMNEDDSTLDDTPNDVTMIENIIPQTAVDTPMDVDQNEQKILMATSTNHIPVDLPPPCVNEQGETAILSSEISFPHLDVITEVTEVNSIEEASEKTIEKSIFACASIQEDVSVAKSELSQVTQNYDPIFDDTVPDVANEVLNQFVSPIVFRKVEKVPDLEVTSMYKIVKKIHNEEPSMANCVEYSYPDVEYEEPAMANCNEYSYPDVEYSLADQQTAVNSIPEQFEAETPKTPQPPVIDRTKTIRFAFSPRIILHRIENIFKYQQNLKRASSQMETLDTRKPKRAKVTRTGSNRKTSRAKAKPKTPKATKAKTNATSSAIVAATPIPTPNVASILIENNRAVLHILNTGTVKDIGKLATIGPKKAVTIFNYRALHGEFVNIDSMKVFWSDKAHQKFLMQNNLIV